MTGASGPFGCRARKGRSVAVAQAVNCAAALCCSLYFCVEIVCMSDETSQCLAHTLGGPLGRYATEAGFHAEELLRELGTNSISSFAWSVGRFLLASALSCLAAAR